MGSNLAGADLSMPFLILDSFTIFSVMYLTLSRRQIVVAW